MMVFLSIPAALCSLFFMGGGAYAFASKRSVVSLTMSAAVSTVYAVSFYLVLAYPERSIGFCIAASASLLALVIGIYRMFVNDNTSNKSKCVSTAIYSVGLASTFFYHGVLFTKLALSS